MAGKRCYLCGGRLVDGRCVDCGLDNARNNKTYRLNQSYIEHKVKSADEASGFKRTSNYKEPRAYEEIQQNGRQVYHLKNKAVKSKKPPSMGGILTIIGFIVSLAVAVTGFVSNYVADHRYSESSAVRVESEVKAEETDPYEYVERELSAEGEEYSIVLEPGEYIAGLHLPEGKYKVYLEEGSGTISVHDYENYIYLWESMGTNEDYEEVEEWDDVRIYQGARVEVNGDVRLRLETDTAQTSSMTEGLSNPLTSDVVLKSGEEMVVGEDFQDGVYDIESTGKWCSVTYKIPLHTDYEDEEMNFLFLGKVVSERGKDRVFHNLVLPEGTVICAEDADVWLKPSEIISSEDYDAHYDAYR